MIDAKIVTSQGKEIVVSGKIVAGKPCVYMRSENELSFLDPDNARLLADTIYAALPAEAHRDDSSQPPDEEH